ncbi:MAG: cellulase family glycosylhydrolase [Epsilonproteobacteria bacterium]|nr:cellulase family glycosylhydrolase [Campylobacterota bacterium]
MVFLIFFFLLAGCSDSSNNNSSNVDSYVAEDRILSFDFETTKDWDVMYQNACSLSVSSGGKTGSKSLLVENRLNSYDGPSYNIANSIKADTTYVVRGYIKSSSSENFALMAKIGSSTYKTLNTIKSSPNNWTKFRGFLRVTQSELNNGVKIYINSNTTNGNFSLDSVEIAKVSTKTKSISSLNTVGKHIVKDTQNFKFEGINIIAYSDNNEDIDKFFSYSYFNYDKSDFANIKSLGFNSIRVALWYKIFEDDLAPYVYKEAGFDWLDYLIAWAKENDLYLILDMHAPQCGGFQGPNHITNFWDDSTCKDRFKELWKEIAKRYKDENTIGAYDIINEPCPSTQAEYLTLLNDTISGIRAIDSNHLIIAETSFSSDSEPFTLSHDKIVYDYHFYDPWDSYTDNATSVYGTTINQATLLSNLSEILTYHATRPLNVSEFGQKRDTFITKNAINWVSDSIDIFDANSVGFQYFSYKGNEFGLYDSSENFSENSTKNSTLIDYFQNR